MNAPLGDDVHADGNVSDSMTHHDAGDLTLFFGSRWDAPIVDHARQVDTPVGEPCLSCTEPVEQGDRGLIRATIVSDGNGGWTGAAAPLHAECDLRSVLGHQYSICHCTGYDDSRATARLVWQKVSEHRGRDLAIRVLPHRQEEPS